MKAVIILDISEDDLTEIVDYIKIYNEVRILDVFTKGGK